MATLRTITGVVQHADGSAAAVATVTVTLSQAGTIGSPATQTVSTAPVALLTDTNGNWSTQLYSNADLAPSGTYYTVVEDVYGPAPNTYWISVPNVASGYAAASIQVPQPSNVGISATQQTMTVTGIPGSPLAVTFVGGTGGGAPSSGGLQGYVAFDEVNGVGYICTVGGPVGVATWSPFAPGGGGVVSPISLTPNTVSEVALSLNAITLQTSPLLKANDVNGTRQFTINADGGISSPKNTTLSGALVQGTASGTMGSGTGLTLANTASGTPTPSKTLQVDASGNLGVWNNAGSAEVLAISDTGAITSPAGSGGLDVSLSGVYNVKQFGAKWNLKVLTNGAMASGSTTLTSASSPFSSGDVGKAISVPSAALASLTGGYMTTTISSVTSASAVVLAASAAVAFSSGTVYYGSDDSTPIQNAITAAQSAGGGVVDLPQGGCFVKNLLIASGGVTLRGRGREVTRLCANGNTQVAQTLGSISNPANNLRIADLTMHLGGWTGSVGIQHYYVNRLYVDRCSFINAGNRCTQSLGGKRPMPTPGAPTVTNGSGGVNTFYALVPNISVPGPGNIWIDGYAGTQASAASGTGAVITVNPVNVCPGAGYVRLLANRTVASGVPAASGWRDLGPLNAAGVNGAGVLTWTDTGSNGTAYIYNAAANSNTPGFLRPVLYNGSGTANASGSFSGTSVTVASGNFGNGQFPITGDLQGWYMFPALNGTHGFDPNNPVANPGQQITANSAGTITLSAGFGGTFTGSFDINIAIASYNNNDSTELYFRQCKFHAPGNGQDATMVQNSTTVVYDDCEWANCGNNAHLCYYRNADIKVRGGWVHDTTGAGGMHFADTTQDVEIIGLRMTNNAGNNLDMATSGSTDSGKGRFGYPYMTRVRVRDVFIANNNSVSAAIGLGGVQDLLLEGNVVTGCLNSALQFKSGPDNNVSVASGPLGTLSSGIAKNATVLTINCNALPQSIASGANIYTAGTAWVTSASAAAGATSITVASGKAAFAGSVGDNIYNGTIVSLNTPPQHVTLIGEHYYNNNNNAASGGSGPNASDYSGSAIQLISSAASTDLRFSMRGCVIEDTQTTPTQLVPIGLASGGSVLFDGINIDDSNRLIYYPQGFAGGSGTMSVISGQGVVGVSTLLGNNSRVRWTPGTPTIASGAAIGAGGTVTITGNDWAGSIAVTTASAGTASGTVCTLTLSDNLLVTVPRYLVQIVGLGAVTNTMPTMTTLVTQQTLQIFAQQALTAGTTYTIAYQYVGPY